MNQRLPLRALLVLAVLTAAHGGTFYVDCAAGNDAHDGLSPSSAFGTLAAISSRTFAPGDQILLNRGTTCKGIFSALGSGTPTAPIVLGAYGSGAAPIINGGTYIAAVWLFNQQGWHIENLETTGGTLYGIHIGGDSGPLTHFRITNVAVHDVNGALTTKDSGLIVISPAANGATFNDVVIDGASAWSTTQWAGIEVMGASYQGNMDGPHGLNVTVRNSIVHDVYGDGIVLSMVQGGLIEKSSAWRTGGQPTETIGTPGGIWTWMCNNCTSQFNESWLSTSPGVDGGAFDIDWGTRNNVVQFNYGHDAKGYCASVFGAETLTTSNATVQYNVCVNNARDSAMALRQGDIFLSTWDNGHLDGVSIHDNAIYWSPATDAFVLNNSADFTGAGLNTFKHNILISLVPSFILSNTSVTLDQNNYWVLNGATPKFEYGGSTPTDFASYQAATSQDRHGRVAPLPTVPAAKPRGSLDPSLLEDAQGSPALISLVDDSADSHSQIVVLRSMQEQYWRQGLKLRLLGSPSPDWRLDSIPLASDQTPAAAAVGSTRPMTFLVAADGTIVQRWTGFIPAQYPGLAIQKLLGTWQFGEYFIPSAHLPLKRILPIRPHAVGQAAGAPGSVSQ
jgi:hypothetical protein